MIRAALVGVGGYGRLYLRELLKYHREGRIQLCLAVVRDQEGLESELELLRGMGCSVLPSTKALFELPGDSLDWCCLPTGIDTHRSLTEQALAKGWHVMVEKPAAATVQDVRSMIWAREQAGRQVLVGFQHLYGPAVRQIKESLVSGAIGPVFGIKLKGLWPRSERYFQRNEWAGKEQVDGQWVLDSPVQNAFAHYVNLALFLAGEELEHSADPIDLRTELYRANSMESFDTCCGHVMTREGIVFSFFLSHAGLQTIDPAMEIHGEKGSLQWTDKAYSMNSDGNILHKGSGGSVDQARIRMFSEALAAVERNRPVLCSLENAYAHTKLVNAMHLASRIETIDHRFLQRQQTEHGIQWAIEGIGEAIEKGFENSLLFAEQGLPWARSRDDFDCSRLLRFDGPKRI